MADLVVNKRFSALWLGVAVGILALAVFALTVSASRPAEAAKAGTCESFSVSTGGQTFRGDQKTDHPGCPGR